MVTVRGVYDGKQVQLLDEIDIPPDTEVQVVIPDIVQPAASEEEREEVFWRTLIESGLVKERRNPSQEIDDSFEPIPNPGEPISDTIIRERR